MFFRKRKRSFMPLGSSGAMKVAVLAFIVYALLANHNKPQDPAKPGEKLAHAPAVGDAFQNFDVKQYTKKIVSAFTLPLNIKDLRPGEGLPAVCGQEVTIAYETFLPNGQKLADEATHDKPLKLRIGEGKAMPVFEQGVAGMKPGGKRNLIADSALTYGDTRFARDDMPTDRDVLFQVELLDVSPKLPDPDSTAFRIAMIGYGIGGKPVVCGQPAHVHVTVWDITGKKIFTTFDDVKKALTFTPGKSETMIGLERGVMGMETGERRTLIIPPDLQKTMSGAAPSVTLPLPAHQTILVDVEALP